MSQLSTVEGVREVAFTRFDTELTVSQAEAICNSIYESPTDELMWLKKKMIEMNLFPPGRQMPRTECIKTLLHIETIVGGMDFDDFGELLLAGWPRKNLRRQPKRGSRGIGAEYSKFRHGYDPGYTEKQYSSGPRLNRRKER